MLPSVTSSDEAKRQFDHYSACLRDIDVRAIQPGQSGKDLNTAISERWKTLKPMAHAEITLIDWLKRTNPDDDDDDDLLDEECPARDISNCETEDDSHSDDGLTVVTTSTRRTKSSVALTAAGNNGLRASRFFKGWAYIGSSKGPCRLCSYFLETLPEPSRVSMRQGHGGIYASWRLPDVPPEDAYNVPLATAQEDGTAAMVTKQDLRTLVREQMATAQRLREADLRARDNVLQEILKRLRRDVLHEIEAGCASRRRFDSTTLTRTVATNFGASAVFNPAAATLGESVVEPVFEDTVSESGRHRKAGVVPRMDDDDDGPSEHMKAVSLRRTEPPAVGESAFSEIGGVRDEGLDEWHGFDDD